MDTFTKSYIECALWSTNDESDPSGGEPLDSNYSVDDIDPDTLAKMVADCERFQAENAEDIATYPEGRWTPEEMAGCDFWLTRNGHGAGFWDGDWPEESGNRLDKSCDAYGECDLYVENGTIY